MPPLPLDPVIHQAVRLRVMALLNRNRTAPFVWVRDTLGLTDGNLGSHVARLAEAGYVVSARALTRTGFQVWLRMTPKGEGAYRSYLSALRSYLGQDDERSRDASVEGAAPPGPPRFDG